MTAPAIHTTTEEGNRPMPTTTHTETTAEATVEEPRTPTPAERLEPFIQASWRAAVERDRTGYQPTAEAVAYRALADEALAILGLRR